MRDGQSVRPAARLQTFIIIHDIFEVQLTAELPRGGGVPPQSSERKWFVSASSVLVYTR